MSFDAPTSAQANETSTESQSHRESYLAIESSRLVTSRLLVYRLRGLCVTVCGQAAIAGMRRAEMEKSPRLLSAEAWISRGGQVALGT